MNIYFIGLEVRSISVGDPSFSYPFLPICRALVRRTTPSRKSFSLTPCLCNWKGNLVSSSSIACLAGLLSDPTMLSIPVG